MDLKLNLRQKLLAVAALVLGLVLAAFVLNSYKGQKSASVVNPAQPPVTPPAPSQLPAEAFPQGVPPEQNALNPVNDTSVTGAGVLPVGNAQVQTVQPGPTSPYMIGYPSLN